MSTLMEVRTQVTIDGETMKAIKNMLKSIKKNREFEVLNYVKFDIDNDVLNVTVSQLDFTLQQLFNVDAEGAGSFLIPFDIIRKVTHIKKDSQYTFQVINDNTVEFNKNGATQRINTIDVNEYPKQINAKFDYIGSVNYDEILNLNKALLSVGKSESRPILHSVLIREGKIVSTDSYRLFKADSQINYSDDIKFNLSGVKKLKDMFNKKDGNISVFINDQYIKFELDNKVVIIRQIEDKYPEVDRVIPTDFNLEFIVDNVEQFEQIIKDASEVSKEYPNNVIHFEIVGSQLKITSKSAYGSYENSIEINKNSLGDSFKISMNGKYILDAIKQVESNQLHFKFIDHLRPFTITKPYNDNVLTLVLPVRTY